MSQVSFSFLRHKIFEENEIDRVVHFAAESHVDRSIKNPDVFVKTNVLGTLVMLNAAKAAWELPDGTFKEGKKFLHVSTDEVYGSLEEEGEYFYETTPYDPHISDRHLTVRNCHSALLLLHFLIPAVF